MGDAFIEQGNLQLHGRNLLAISFVVHRLRAR